MKITHTYTFIVLVGGMLLFTSGTADADQSKKGTQAQSGSEGSIKQGHESSGKIKQEPFGRTGEPKVGGEAILGGSGQIPDSSKVPGLPHDKSSGSGSGDTQTSPGQTGSSGSQGSSGGMRSSGATGGSGN